MLFAFSGLVTRAQIQFREPNYQIFGVELSIGERVYIRCVLYVQGNVRWLLTSIAGLITSLSTPNS